MNFEPQPGRHSNQPIYLESIDTSMNEHNTAGPIDTDGCGNR